MELRLPRYLRVPRRAEQRLCLEVPKRVISCAEILGLIEKLD